MRVTDVEAIPVSVPVSSSLRTSGETVHDSFDHVLVRVVLADGTVGYGEIAPMSGWRHAGTRVQNRHLVADAFAPLVEGSSVHRIERTVARLDDAVTGHPFALAGVDAALHDALGRLLDVPVFDLLGGPVGDRTLDLHATVGAVDPASVASTAERAAADGFVDFKLKVGDDPNDDRARVEAIRAAVPDARIRVDANGAWSVADAIASVRALDEIADGLVFVEQPVSTPNHGGLRRVREATGVPVLADESCYGAGDVVRLVEADAVDGVTLKLANAGGFCRARDAATVARAHGLDCLAGGMLELGVGAAATAHFAVSTPAVAFPTGALNRFASDTLLSNEAAWRPTGPRFELPDAAGLGIEVDEARVERFRVD